jgi:hypothetical protein
MTDQRLLGFEGRTRAVIRTRPTLDGRAWALVFSWNSRAVLWYLDTADAAGVDVCRGVACVVGMDLFGAIPGESRPAGQLWIQDTSGRRAEPGRHDLGRRHRVLYRPIATVLAAASDPTLVVL